MTGCSTWRLTIKRTYLNTFTQPLLRHGRGRLAIRPCWKPRKQRLHFILRILSPSGALFDQSIRKPDVRRGDYTSPVALLRTDTIEPSAVSYSAIVIAISMRLSAICRRIIASDTGVIVLSATALVALHTATNGQYGFHRDELATIDDARFLSWGYE